VESADGLPSDQLIECVGSRSDEAAHSSARGEANHEPFPSPEICCLADWRAQSACCDSDSLGEPESSLRASGNGGDRLCQYLRNEGVSGCLVQSVLKGLSVVLSRATLLPISTHTNARQMDDLDEIDANNSLWELAT